MDVLSAVTALEGAFESGTVCSFGVSANVTLNGFDTELKISAGEHSRLSRLRDEYFVEVL